MQELLAPPHPWVVPRGLLTGLWAPSESGQLLQQSRCSVGISDFVAVETEAQKDPKVAPRRSKSWRRMCTPVSYTLHRALPWRGPSLLQLWAPQLVPDPTPA